MNIQSAAFYVITMLPQSQMGHPAQEGAGR